MSVRIAALFGLVLALLALGFFAVFNVPVDSQALVLRGSDVQRKVGPGIQLHIPLVEQVVTEPVLRERQFSFDAPFDIQGCRAEVTLIYRIGDLETYHGAGGDLASLQDKRRALEEALSTLPDLARFNDAATPYGTRIEEHLAPLAGPVAGGLHINWINTSLEEGCEPKRIVKQQPLALIIAQPVGELAAERASPGSMRATTADGVELQIEGFVATYEIQDQTKADNCFGQNRDLIAARIGNLAERAAGDTIRGLVLDQLAQFPAALQGALSNNDLDQCGLVLGAVDFSDASIVRRTVVNCTETQDQACDEKAIVIPGFSALTRP